jgi:short-subunit dehydrogenase
VNRSDGDSTRGLALVTGASSGIGAAFARALAARRYPLLLVARRRERLAQLARELGGDVAILAVDLTAPDAIARINEALSSLPPLEILINNAGYATHGEFVDRDGGREREMIRLNTLAPLQLTHALLPALIARGRGGIINVSSIAAFQAVPYMATYGATKAFVLSWSEALYEELRDTGVRVLCLCPGPTATEFFAVAGMPPSLSKWPHTMRADDVVARALDAFADDRALIVPGLINFLGAVMARVAPRVVARKLTGLMFRPRPAKPKVLPERS